MNKLARSVLVLLLLVIFATIVYLFLKRTEGFESSSPTTIAYYYLPQCGWCKKFNPTWEQFVEKVKEEKLPVITKKLDASDSKNEEAVEKHGIKGFPHVQMEKGDKVKVFEGERTVPALMDFAKSSPSA